MSSTFKTFAVAGVGNLGSFIVKALLQKKQSGLPIRVITLSRSTSPDAKFESLISQGAEFRTIAYESKSSLVDSLAGVNVVISALGSSPGGGIGLQGQLAEAAKEAGVRLFVPSEYGRPSDSEKDPKAQFHGKLKALGLPYTLFFNGPFPDFVFSPFLGLDIKNGSVKISGDGNVPISFTAREDIARYMAHVLTSLPAETLEWRIFRIEGDRQTLNDVVKAYEEKTGKKINVSYQPVSELQEAMKANPKDFLTMVKLAFAQGLGAVVGAPEELANGEFPDWNPKKVIDVLTS
ncbi:NAD-P-binding protein [Stereum hirsutum FP-91666 SS1]|uniref:NAD-P-binding protein n=1 Tax=Stereum hirsutum (strain FP-91666) TaxID=721885 RepID=UPI00044495CC|nr:NAD-P-binding protein [Stereum hirsutum FP-91666 SS1]EIM81244.1 NAD-P-binding protein [Stereum hirsutum FP-91666 SS1]